MRLIDADALNAYIESAECNSVGKALQAIDNAPTISPDEVRVDGKWSKGGYFDEMYGMSCVCSACGRSALGFPNYCPNCGAKMEVSEDV